MFAYIFGPIVAAAVVIAAAVCTLSAHTATYIAAVIFAAMLLPPAAVVTVRAIKKKEEWPDLMSVALVQSFMTAYFCITAERVPLSTVLLAEATLVAISLTLIFWAWIRQHAKAVLKGIAAAIVLTTAIVLLIPLVKYGIARNQLNAGDWDTAAASFEALNGYLDSDVRRLEAVFGKGKALHDAGNAEGAYAVLGDIAEYAPAAEYLNGPLTDLTQKYSAYEVGEMFTLGTYDGRPLTWRILSRSGSTRLVVCDRNVCRTKYNGLLVETLWENTGIRTWLNGTFYEEAFTETERNAVLTTVIENIGSKRFKIDGGADTEDSVFLLSYEEAQLFADDADRRCEDGDWWLRTPGCSEIDFMTIYPYGGFNLNGNNVNYSCGVRPAMKVDVTVLAEGAGQ